MKRIPFIISERCLFFLLAMMSFPFFSPPVFAAASLKGADHVFIIIMENKGFGEIVHRTDAPYFNSLSGGRLSSYWSLAHPSLPNYVGMMGAWPPLPASDDPRIRLSGDSLPEEMVRHGHSVGSYMQGLPRPGFGGKSAPPLFGRYVLKHDPFLLFSRLRESPVRKTVVPLRELPEDLARGRIPELSLIVPDLCHDMHGAFACHFHNRHELVKAGDRFLARWIPVIEGSQLFRAGRVWIFVLWDESGYGEKSGFGGDADRNRDPLPKEKRLHAGGHIPFLWIDSKLSRPWQSSCFANHYSLLESLTRNFSLPDLAPPGERVPLPGPGRVCSGN